MMQHTFVLLLLFGLQAPAVHAEEVAAPITPPVVTESEPSIATEPDVSPVVTENEPSMATVPDVSPVASIRGGESYDVAVPIAFDKDYKLDHHQKVGYFDHFYLDLNAGQEVTIELRTFEKGVNLHGETPLEGGVPYAGVEIHDSHRKKLQSGNIVGIPHSTETTMHTASHAGRHYLLIGSTYNNINKDHMSFRVSTVFKGDLDGKKDAGDTITHAMPMEARRYQNNYIGSTDLKDVFSFRGNKGETYFIGIIPHEDSDSFFRISIYDSYKQKIISQESGVNEGIKTNPFSLPDDGIHYLQIDLGNTIERPLSYTLELKRISPPSPEVTKPPPQSKQPPSTPSPQTNGPGPRARPSETSLPPAQ